MFALCVEASHARGMGHLFRALALTEEMERQGADTLFIVNDSPAARDVLRKRARPFEIAPLSETGWETEIIQRHGVRTWINDRLDTDMQHARMVCDNGVRLVTFEDRGTGAALADLNIVPIPLQDAEALQGKHVLSGLDYLVLDPAIANLRRRRTDLNSLVVSMGGSDTYGVTIAVMGALKARSMAATIILGPGFEHEAALEEALDERFTVKRNVPSLAAEFAHHDLAITAGGVTPCEANAAGLPCMIIATELWEKRTGEILAKTGGCLFAGYRDHIDFDLLDLLPPVAAMSQAALDHIPVDGADRIARAILDL